MIKTFFLSLAIFVLQVSFFGYLDVFLVPANIFLISILTAALLMKFEDFLYFSFFSAILNDIYSENFFGFFLIFAAIFSLAVYFMQKILFRRFDLITAVILLFVAEIVFVSQEYLLGLFIPNSISFAPPSFKAALVEFLYSASLFFFLFFLIGFLKKKKTAI